MSNFWKCILLSGCILLFSWGGRLISDRRQLRQELIRFHVVANSDDPRDQAVKIQVRDSVLEYIRSDLQQIHDADAAKSYLKDHLPAIEDQARETLMQEGFVDNVTVSLCRERFDTRLYNTFSLPSGVYESLRIIIGDGDGHNWWCITFPDLCLPATSDRFRTAAVGAGFSEELTRTLDEPETYKVRFFFLDTLGKLENILFTAK